MYDANDRLLTITGSSNYGRTFTYDANGNTLTVSGTGGASSASYTWEPRGRMISATTGGATSSFTYDDSNNRTSEATGGSTTSFLNTGRRSPVPFPWGTLTAFFDLKSYTSGIMLEYRGAKKMGTYMKVACATVIAFASADLPAGVTVATTNSTLAGVAI